EIAITAGITKLSRDETDILRRMFDPFSYAPYVFKDAFEFRRSLSEIRPKQLQRDIRAAILWSLPFTIGGALINRNFADFWRFLYVYLILARPSAVIRSLFCRSFFETGLELVRFRRSGTQDDVQDASLNSAA